MRYASKHILESRLRAWIRELETNRLGFAWLAPQAIDGIKAHLQRFPYRREQEPSSDAASQTYKEGK